MRAAVVNALGGGFELEDVEIASPIGREVLIDIKACGLCHTDATLTRFDMGYEIPAVAGHEISGVVAEVGPDVARLKPCDHVVACGVQSCGSCRVCLAGKPYQCPYPEVTERTVEDGPRLSRGGKRLSQIFGLGGFAQQALIHENQLVVVPDMIPFPQAALIGCGVMSGAGAVLNAAKVQAGDNVVVVGVGGVGLNAVSGGRLAAASKIIAVDIDDTKLQKARRFGATDLVNSTRVDPVETVRALTRGGAEHVFDFVGLEEVGRQDVEMLAVGGGLYIVGNIDPKADVAVNVLSSVLRQIRVQGVTLGSSVFTKDVPMYADLYLQGRLNLDDLVSEEISLSDVNEGYAALKDPALTRVVITSF